MGVTTSIERRVNGDARHTTTRRPDEHVVATGRGVDRLVVQTHSIGRVSRCRDGNIVAAADPQKKSLVRSQIISL